MPTRVTDPAEMQILRRLSETGQLKVIFEECAVPSASVVEFTPLRETVLKCMRTGSLPARSHNRSLS